MPHVQSDISNGDAGPWICFFILIAFNVIVYFINERNVFRRCCGCNRGAFLGITNRAAKAPKRPESFFVWDLLDAKHLASGRHVPAAMLIVFRLFCVAVFVFTIIWQAYGTKKLRYNLEDDFMTFFTNWTFVGFALCSLLGAAVAAMDLKTGNRSGYNDWTSPVPPAQSYTLLHKAFHFMYMAVTPSSAALAIFYWLIIYDGSGPTVDNIIKHGGSFGLLALDLLLGRMAIVTYHCVVAIWYITAYTIFLWLYYDQTGQWVYKSLNWEQAGRSVYYLAMVILVLAMVAFLYALAGLREFFLTGKCCCICGCCANCGECCEPGEEEEAEAGYGSSNIYKAPQQEQFATR